MAISAASRRCIGYLFIDLLNAGRRQAKAFELTRAGKGKRVSIIDYRQWLPSTKWRSNSSQSCNYRPFWMANANWRSGKRYLSKTDRFNFFITGEMELDSNKAALRSPMQCKQLRNVQKNAIEFRSGCQRDLWPQSIFSSMFTASSSGPNGVKYIHIGSSSEPFVKELCRDTVAIIFVTSDKTWKWTWELVTALAPAVLLIERTTLGLNKNECKSHTFHHAHTFPNAMTISDLIRIRWKHGRVSNCS